MTWRGQFKRREARYPRRRILEFKVPGKRRQRGDLWMMCWKTKENGGGGVRRGKGCESR